MQFISKKAYQKPTVGFRFFGLSVMMFAVMRNMTTTAFVKKGQKEREKHKKMKNIIRPLILAGLFAAGGCNTPVNISGDYAVPGQTISGDFNATTNGVTVSGSYATTNQTVGGSVTVGK
jgi:hypothetical protein